MANAPEFKLTITVDGESQSFPLGAGLLENLVSSMSYVDSAEFAGVFSAAARHPAASLRKAVAGHDHLPGDVALDLANDPCASVRAQVPRSSMFRRVAPEAVILSLIESDPEVAVTIAELVPMFENADINVLCAALARHPDPLVRRTLAEYGGAPLSWLKQLCDDKMKDVADVARSQLKTRLQ